MVCMSTSSSGKGRKRVAGAGSCCLVGYSRVVFLREAATYVCETWPLAQAAEPAPQRQNRSGPTATDGRGSVAPVLQLFLFGLARGLLVDGPAPCRLLCFRWLRNPTCAS